MYKRWLDIAGYSIIATAFAVIFHQFLLSWAKSVEVFWQDWQPWQIRASCFIFLVPLFVPLLNLRFISPWRFGNCVDCVFRRHICPLFFRYPGTIWSCVLPAIYLAVASALGLSAWPPLKYRLSVWGWAYGLIALAIFAILVTIAAYSRSSLIKKKKTPLSTGKNQHGIASFIADPVRFAKWLSREAPVIDPQDDLFETSGLARRFAEGFCGKQLQSIALIGPYGSGKSTVFRLVHHFVTDRLRTKWSKGIPRFVWLCRVDGWGLHAGPSAAEYILSGAIDELSKHIDCSSLNGLPAHYRAALEGTGTASLKIAAALFTNGESPAKLLLRIDQVLRAVDSRLVIVIEDVDRNPEYARLYEEIGALFDNLRELKNVTFAIAATDNE